MTIEQLKKYKGCEHYSDEEAQEIVENLRIFAKTIIEVWPYICIDNQPIRHLDKNISGNSLISNQLNTAA